MKKNAFTMIELVFVIVVMGIIGKFGTEFLAQAYKNFISTKIQNKYQNQSATAVEFIARRLQYRIQNSVIVRKFSTFNDYKSLEGFQNSNYNVLEWVSYSSEGLNNQSWSGIYSKKKSNTELYSPETNTTKLNNLIIALSHSNKTINDAAVYFIGSDDNWGWDGNRVADFTASSMKPIKAGTSLKRFAANYIGTDDFSDLDLKNKEYNSYQLSWTANAIVFDKNNQQLWFYTDYQPWNGDKYTDARSKSLIMEEVSDFRKKQNKRIITIKVCSINEKLKDLDESDFLTCKEKTIL